jgi:eukaryotic-like serine/threonine-protein kinase
MNAVNPAVDAATPKACPSCGARYPADALFCSHDGAPLVTSPGAIAAVAATDPYVGREILGHIEIRQLVGLGAMGRVYRAFQKGIDRDVAVKILHRELSSNQMLVTRFHREAKVASRLAHPNVVHVLLTGQLPDGALYIVMEYLDGLSLQSALAATGGAMPLPRALHIALQLCDAAGEAHAQGVVHRDLKPENVMLVKRADDPDSVKVLDFGIARLNWGEQSMATAAGLIFGTARYISPEGAQGEKVGPQGDVYSIATMVYQMLSGRTPFDGEQAVALLVQQIHDLPAHLRSVPRAAYVPDPIADVIMANLVKKPDERLADARSFGRALLDGAVASGLSAQDILARPSMLGPARGPHSSVVQLPSMQRTSKLQLGPADAARIAVHKTEYEPLSGGAVDSRVPPARTEIPESVGLPPGHATTKWSPPDGFAARLIPTPPPSSVDATMDDQQLPPAARGIQAGLAESEPRSDLRELRSLPLHTPAPPSSPARAIPTPAPSAPSTPTPRTVADTSAPLSRTAPPSSKPPSSVDSTMAGEETPRLPLGFVGGAIQPRTFAVVVVCFFLGVLGMGGVAYKTGLIGGHSRASQVDSFVARANDALAHDRWDAPAGDNVRELTDQGLARFPGDPQLLRVRARACEAVVVAARQRSAAGDDATAVRLAALAAELDPADATASALVQELASPAPAAPTESTIPPLAGGHGASAAAGARASIDVSSAKPAIGQPVDLSGRVVGAARTARIDGPVFRISGPGIAAGTQLEATDGGSGVYRATFAFLQAGRYEVGFSARADGVPVRSARAVIVGDSKPSLPLPAVTGSIEPLPATPPTASGKWL